MRNTLYLFVIAAIVATFASPTLAQAADGSSNMPILLVAAGGEPPDAAAVCRHAAEDRGAAVAGGMRRAQREANFDDDAGAKGKVSAEPFGKRAARGVARPSDAKPAPSRRRWEHRGPKPAKTLPSEAIWSIRRVGSESQNGNPGLISWRDWRYDCVTLER